MSSQKIKLRYKDRDILFKKEYTQLKIRVTLNWLEVFMLLITSFFIVLKISLSFNFGTILPSTGIAILSSLVIIFTFSYFRNYHLKITRFDKEDIYKKISNDLIEGAKNNE